MTHDVIVAFAALGVAGQAIVAALALIGLLALAGVRAPLGAIRAELWGYELWGAFVVAALATGGSLFFSQIAGFVPCELCWFQRICMYPLSLLLLFAAYHGDYKFARYLLPFPLIGGCVSVYHL
ncbi:MAG: disulfide bond formation protein B, partial [Gaiellaceae bacterium]